MSAYKELTELFNLYIPDERQKTLLEGSEILSIDLSKTDRSVSMVLKAEKAADHVIKELEQALSDCYGCSVKITAATAAGIDDILATTLFRLPAARPFLADASLEQQEGIVVISLAHGGAEILERMQFTQTFAEIYANSFGRGVQVRLAGLLDITSKANEIVQRKKSELFSKAVERPAVKALSKNDIAPADDYFDEAAFSQIVFGRSVGGKVKDLCDVTGNDTAVVVRGEVFSTEQRETWDKKRVIFTYYITDYTSSMAVKLLVGSEYTASLEGKINAGDSIKIKGEVKFDKYLDDLIVEASAIAKIGRKKRTDTAENKRVELHLHTNMSAMDAVTDIKDYLACAKSWGLPAIAITDHGVVQAFPDAAIAAKKIGYEGKIIYGCEAYFVNDCAPVVTGTSDMPFDGEFVVFDVETTGFDPRNEALTEIGAVKVKGGVVTDRFQTFVDPGKPISPRITEITGITDEMVADAPKPSEAVESFLNFAEGCVLAAHNAKFDMSFIAAVKPEANSFTFIDTVVFARYLFKGLKNYKLDTVAEHLGFGGFNHHRADADAEVTAKILLEMFVQAKADGAGSIGRLNAAAAGNVDIKKAKSYHQIILIKNEKGRKNLYELVSMACLKYFSRNPRIPKSELNKHREGLIIGSACEAGELFSALLEDRPWAELCEIAGYYDYLEIQPVCNNRFLVENGTVKSFDGLRELNKTIIKLGEKLGLPVVATGDVHFLNPEDEQYRHVLMAAMKFSDADKELPLYLRTTDEMLEEFSYLGKEKAYEVVVTNTQKIAEMCENVKPVPGGQLYPPEIPGCEDELERRSREKAAAIYGTPLPDLVLQRMEKELTSIIKHGFAVMYITAQRLVAKSMSDGYLVGSRGSVGSSFVAFLAGITEVNALAPHYICRNCKHSEFVTDGGYEAGCDLPDKICPQCGTQYEKDGFDIPFETFLGFEGDKTPDIDLNFSGEYQAKAHKYTEELFGTGNTFKAGTIGTLADKTAYGFVLKYFEERGLTVRAAEKMRLAVGCTGVKRSTGQHPGGIIVVPQNKDITDFTPVQRPADAQDKDIITTHFDYHKIEDNLLKLDILGHDDPTVIRMLEDITGVDAKRIKLDDKATMSLYHENKLEGCTDDAILTSVGACALPEFGTRFVRGMLEDTRPTTFAELVRIAGLSHGTDVWLGNAKELIKNGVTDLRGAICTRDDIMNYLISKGVPAKTSFTIMEAVRKGKGLKPDWESEMREHEVPEWYIDSCKKIKYMFPKAHAVAYVMMAYRIAWFKVNHPYAFYAAYFTVRADDFDATHMIYGVEKLLKRYKALAALPKATDKEQKQMIILEVGYEFYKRGLKFLPLDLYRSDATKFIVTEEGLLPPLNSLPGLGETAAISVVKEREKEPFLSVDELMERTKLTKTIATTMREIGMLGGMPESAQVTLF